MQITEQIYKEDEINLYDIFFSILKGWKIVLSIIFISLVLFFNYALSKSKETTSSIEIREKFDLNMSMNQFLSEALSSSGVTKESIFNEIVERTNSFNIFEIAYKRAVHQYNLSDLEKNLLITNENIYQNYRNNYSIQSRKKAEANSLTVSFTTTFGKDFSELIIKEVIYSTMSEIYESLNQVMLNNLRNIESKINQSKNEHLSSMKSEKKVLEHKNAVLMSTYQLKSKAKMLSLQKDYDIAKKLNMEQPVIDRIIGSLQDENIEFPRFLLGTLVLSKEIEKLEGEMQLEHNSLNSHILAELSNLELKSDYAFVSGLRSLNKDYFTFTNAVESLKELSPRNIEGDLVNYNLNRILHNSYTNHIYVVFTIVLITSFIFSILILFIFNESKKRSFRFKED